jgi:D-alanine-D-alanine ligase
MVIKRNKIAIIHNEPINKGQPFYEASRDVLVQVDAIDKALRDIGFSPVRIPFTRDIYQFLRRLNEEEVEMIFNLCETVDEDPQLSWHPACIFELLDIPFSGSPSVALMITTDKFLTKRLLKEEGIMTPRCQIYEGNNDLIMKDICFPVIAKPRFMDGSIGIDQGSIFENEKELKKGLSEFYCHFGPILVEEYIEGREFNVSVLGYPSPKVLPVAEVDYSNFPASLYPIVSYKAKWEPESFEYRNTPLKFPGPEELSPIHLEMIQKTALKCFNLFMVRDYGRIDMRLDKDGMLYVLEVNANPCLSPDAGFATAVEMAGMTYRELVENLLEFMINRAEKEDGYQTNIIS